MIIGFSQWRITVPEHGHDYDGYNSTYSYNGEEFYSEYNYYHDFDDAIIDVVSERVSEGVYTVVFSVEEDNSTATVGTEEEDHSPFNSEFRERSRIDSDVDVIFGKRVRSDGPIQKILELAPGENMIKLFVEIVNDLVDEIKKCFTINVSPLYNEFMCSNDKSAARYFCNLRICIDDDDGKLNNFVIRLMFVF